MAHIEIDSMSGFCFGVVTAIRKAEEELANSGTLYCLGDIVHNNQELERLQRIGLRTIDATQFASLHDVRVLLRAHGEPPTTYEIARRNAIEIIDATCPVVLKLQQQIAREYREAIGTTRQIVIYGKRGHAEVLGLVGQTEGRAIVIERLEEAQQLDFGRDITLYSQTTMSVDEFEAIVAYISSHIAPTATFRYADTICRKVASRILNIRRFAACHDLIFFVSSKKSSNGKILFEQCRQVNPRSFLIDSADEIDATQLQNATSIGICGATSTPKWLMEDVYATIERLV
jgi:4-hydroxy-3-methylbut-2-enyl diphosphate reductase